MIYAENILLCIAIPLIVSLFFLRGSAHRFVAAFLLGMGVCLLSAYISGFLNLVTGMGSNDTSVFISPIIEELMKLLPLMFFMLLLAPGERNLVMFAVAIGAGFATFENCCYILSSGADRFAYILIRGMAVGVMHIVSILALAIWLIIARRHKAFTFSSVIGALSLAMVFHALYNLLVSASGTASVIGYLLPLLAALLLFILYRRLPFQLDE